MYFLYKKNWTKKTFWVDICPWWKRKHQKNIVQPIYVIEKKYAPEQKFWNNIPSWCKNMQPKKKHFETIYLLGAKNNARRTKQIFLKQYTFTYLVQKKNRRRAKKIFLNQYTFWWKKKCAMNQKYIWNNLDAKKKSLRNKKIHYLFFKLDNLKNLSYLKSSLFLFKNVKLGY